MSSQERYQRTLEALSWNGQYALDLCSMRRCLERNVAEERMNRRQTQVAGSGGDAAHLLEVIEEVDNQRCVDVLERER